MTVKENYNDLRRRLETAELTWRGLKKLIRWPVYVHPDLLLTVEKAGKHDSGRRIVIDGKIYWLWEFKSPLLDKITPDYYYLKGWTRL